MISIRRCHRPPANPWLYSTMGPPRTSRLASNAQCTWYMRTRRCALTLIPVPTVNNQKIKFTSRKPNRKTQTLRNTICNTVIAKSVASRLLCQDMNTQIISAQYLTCPGMHACAQMHRKRDDEAHCLLARLAPKNSSTPSPAAVLCCLLVCY